MTKKELSHVFLLFPAVLMLVSCSTTPYASMRGWVMRQNATPRYFAVYDIFCIPPSLFTGNERELQNWTRQKETERVYNFVYYQMAEQYGNKVRFFVPQVHLLPKNEAGEYLNSELEDFRKTPFESVIENSLESFNYYLENYHVPGRPFIIVGQGQGALAAYEMMKRCKKITPENGFVAAYLTGMPGLKADRIEKDFSGRGIHPAAGMLDTGVILGWCVPGNSEPEEISPDPDRYVINPLSWKRTADPVPAGENIRSVFYNEFNPNPLERKLEGKNFCGAAVDGQNGVLKILPGNGMEKEKRFIESQRFRYNDMGLFFQSIMTNMGNRVDQYNHNVLWRNRKQHPDRDR